MIVAAPSIAPGVMVISLPDNSRPEKDADLPAALVRVPAPRYALISGIAVAVLPNEYVCSSLELESNPFHSLPPIESF